MNDNRPKFTRQQIEWLDKTFPEPSKEYDPNKLLVRVGQREVVNTIRSMLVKSNLPE